MREVKYFECYQLNVHNRLTILSVQNDLRRSTLLQKYCQEQSENDRRLHEEQEEERVSDGCCQC